MVSPTYPTLTKATFATFFKSMLESLVSIAATSHTHEKGRKFSLNST